MSRTEQTGQADVRTEENVVQTEAVATEQVVEIEGKTFSFPVKRVKYGETKDAEKKPLYSYKVEQILENNGFKLMQRAEFEPKDIGGHNMLLLIFAGKNVAELSATYYEMEIDERTISGYKYSISSIDEKTGVKFELPVKPRHDSDKSVLDSLIQLKERNLI